jgi:sec-independent protein translocase protein TatC
VNVADPADLSTKPFVEHLDDLRQVVLRSGLFLLLGLLIAIPLAPTIFALVRGPFDRAGLDVVLRVTQVGGGLSILLRIVLWAGLILSLPFVVMAVGGFVIPGLSLREKTLVYRGGAASIGLFAMGILMAYQWTVPVALRMMARIEGWLGTPADFWETAGYVSFVLKLLLAFGLAFQLPLLVYMLGSMGIITSRQMRDKRRHVAVGLLVVGMIMTPPDPLTMILMAAPLIALYEICIWLVRAREDS